MIRLGGLAGILTGSALAALGFVASVVVAPPNPRQAPMERAVPETAPEASSGTTPVQPRDTTAPTTDALPDAAPQIEERDTASGSGDAPQREALSPPKPDIASAAQSPPPSPETAATRPEESTPPPSVPMADVPEPDGRAVMAELAPPTLPGPTLRDTQTELPETPMPPRDGPLPDSPAPPAPSTTQDPAPDMDTAPAPDTAPDPDLTPEQDSASEEIAPRAPESDDRRLPGTRITGLPGQTTEAPASASGALPEPETTTALERNSSFDGPLAGAPLMSIVLNDPGLPMPLRRSLAALELPVTIALNPMDPSAAEAAEIYRDAGKEVLILATGLPSGARATDLDITLSAWFDALPQAVGVLDLPRGGFARNTSLTNGVLPLIAQDGHGLLSFSGGLSRISNVAAREGVPHAEVFRVLDDEDQSQFTIRRYLDRAVFQASQIGEVIVFGDATNDATMEALDMWRSDGRMDQVAVVPVSAILLSR